MIEGRFDASHITTFTSVFNLFDSVDFILWDNKGFLSRSGARPGIRKKEDAKITLSIVGLLGSQIMIAIIDLVFLLPFGKYSQYEQVPISEWNSIRSGLSTDIVTTKSTTLLDGIII